MFSANMRMVGKSSVEKLAAVDRMIELLHLERCHDTLVHTTKLIPFRTCLQLQKLNVVL